MQLLGSTSRSLRVALTISILRTLSKFLLQTKYATKALDKLSSAISTAGANGPQPGFYNPLQMPSSVSDLGSSKGIITLEKEKEKEKEKERAAGDSQGDSQGDELLEADQVQLRLKNVATRIGVLDLFEGQKNHEVKRFLNRLKKNFPPWYCALTVPCRLLGYEVDDQQLLFKVLALPLICFYY